MVNFCSFHLTTPGKHRKPSVTTFDDTLFPETAETSYDAGRLQKGSVPLGTIASVSKWRHQFVCMILNNQ